MPSQATTRRNCRENSHPTTVDDVIQWSHCCWHLFEMIVGSIYEPIYLTEAIKSSSLFSKTAAGKGLLLSSRWSLWTDTTLWTLYTFQLFSNISLELLLIDTGSRFTIISWSILDKPQTDHRRHVASGQEEKMKKMEKHFPLPPFNPHCNQFGAVSVSGLGDMIRGLAYRSHFHFIRNRPLSLLLLSTRRMNIIHPQGISWYILHGLELVRHWSTILIQISIDDEDMGATLSQPGNFTWSEGKEKSRHSILNI